MKILHVINDAQLGGAETLLAKLAEAWPADDSLHLVVLRERGDLSVQYEDTFDSVTHLSMRNALDLPRAARMLRQTVRSLAPDLVHSHLMQSDFLNLLVTPRRTRNFSTIHTTGFKRSDPLLSRLIARANGALSSKFEGVILCSDGCRSFVDRMRYRGPRYVIPNGVSVPEKYRPSEASTIFSAARLHPMKGHEVLFAAFAQAQGEYPDWVLRCAGDGVTIQNPKVREMLTAANAVSLYEEGRIELIGPTRHIDAELEASAATVISSTYGEASPMIGIESLAAGRCLIATDLGSGSDLASSPALVAEPGSVDSLARALRAFYDLDIEERHALERGGRRLVVDQLSVDACIRRYRDVYGGVVHAG